MRSERTIIRPVLLLAAASRAAAFGSVDLGDQEFEHEKITRASLACPPDTPAAFPFDCFEPKSMDMLAGTKFSAGAVGAPDADEIFDAKPHCDNADFLDLSALGLEGTYAQSREEASAALFECVGHLRGRITQGLDAAERVLDSDGLPSRDETDIDDIPCVFVGGVQGRAKCNVIEGLGRALHGVQDFYAHSNWVDLPDSTQAISVDNPPGLNRTDRPQFLQLTDTSVDLQTVEVPRDLATGCFKPSVLDPIEGARDCEAEGRITHVTLNKDNGVIAEDPLVEVAPGVSITQDPKTARGQVANNFEQAVGGAINETRRQWEDFREALKARYGEEKGLEMIRALVEDAPWEGGEDAESGAAKNCKRSYAYKMMVVGWMVLFRQ